MIPTFSTRLCGPISTSKHREIAVRFADDKGIVIKLNNIGLRYNWVKCLNVSFISKYTEEDERLFFGGRYPLRVESIFVIGSAHNWFYFDSMINGYVLPTDEKHIIFIGGQDEWYFTEWDHIIQISAHYHWKMLVSTIIQQ